MPENIIKNICCDLNLALLESGENYGWEVIRARTKVSAAEKRADAKLKTLLFTDDSDLPISSENCPLKMETIIILNFTWKQEPQHVDWPFSSCCLCINIYLAVGNWAASVWWGWWGSSLWKVAGTNFRRGKGQVPTAKEYGQWNTCGFVMKSKF